MCAPQPATNPTASASVTTARRQTRARSTVARRRRKGVMPPPPAQRGWLPRCRGSSPARRRACRRAPGREACRLADRAPVPATPPSRGGRRARGVGPASGKRDSVGNPAPPNGGCTGHEAAHIVRPSTAAPRRAGRWVWSCRRLLVGAGRLVGVFAADMTAELVDVLTAERTRSGRGTVAELRCLTLPRPAAGFGLIALRGDARAEFIS